MAHMNSQERAVHRAYVGQMGVRSTPTENQAGYLEHRSTVPALGQSSYPHGSPASGATPAHVTDIRRDATVQGFAQLVVPVPGQGAVPNPGAPYTIHERFHRHIAATARGGAGRGPPMLDRHRASTPREDGTHDLFAATVDHGTRTTTIHSGGGATERPISPRTQGR